VLAAEAKYGRASELLIQAGALTLDLFRDNPRATRVICDHGAIDA